MKNTLYIYKHGSKIRSRVGIDVSHTPASAALYSSYLTKNVLPLERASTHGERARKGKERTVSQKIMSSGSSPSSPPWHRCKDPAQESWERRTLELELVNPLLTQPSESRYFFDPVRRRHQSSRVNRANTNNKINTITKESGKLKAREFDPAQMYMMQRTAHELV
ncbi:hypothetical protein J6590_083294 [Homalodisca vitripennis]|nr:hypothetical protein J6590_083294 [Homalodisca vitripennis]